MPILRHCQKPLFGLAAAALALIQPVPAAAFSPYLVIPEPEAAEATPAYRYANMTDAEAFEALDQRKILYTKLGSVFGVRAPVRLTGRLHGVYIHSSLPPEERVTSMFEILDARLLLALDDFAAVLERHDIDEVIHFTMYRPNVAGPSHGVEEEPQPSQASARSRASQGVAHRSAGPASTPALALAAKAKAPAGRAAAKPAGKPPAPSLGPKGAIEGGKSSDVASLAVKHKASPPGEKPVVMVTQASKKAPSLGRGKGPAAVAAKAAPGSKPRAGAVAHRDPQASGLHQTTWAPPGTRHPAGLAIDVGLVHKKDGRWLSVAQHFQGHIGDKTCGEGVRIPENADARELHALVCESADVGVFTYVLTPDYNAAHADHFHMEIKPGVHWFLYH